MGNGHDLKVTIRKRLEFIEFQLFWEGTVGRKKLQDQFSISPQQATKDLNSYIEFCPDNLLYDPRLKTYVRSPKFKTYWIEGTAEEYLMQLELLHQGHREAKEIWIDTQPSFDIVSAQSRKIDPKTLSFVLAAIRFDARIQMRYVSLSSNSEAYRILKPHSIASDGHRWHVRAFDCDKKQYSDFVLSRIEEINLFGFAEEDMPRDEAWVDTVPLVLMPDTSLESSARKKLQLEYGMKKGRLRLEVRQAMLFYYLRYYGFDPFEMDKGVIRNKSSFRLMIANLKEVERCIGRRK